MKRIVTIVSTVALLSCGRPTPPPAAEAQATATARPLRCCIMQDLSGSIADNRVPRITPAELQELAGMLSESGGELGFGILQEQSDRTLVRLAVEQAPPPPPPRPQNPLDLELWERERQKAEQARLAWQAEQQRRTEAFLRQAEARMQGKLAQRSDVCGAIRRCELMLAEPTPADSLRVLMLVSDGLHNVRDSACPERLAPQTTLLLINGSGLQGVVEAYRPLRFESFTAAIRHLRSMFEGGEGRESR